MNTAEVKLVDVSSGRHQVTFQAWVKTTNGKTEYQKDVDGEPHDEYGWYSSPTQAWRSR